MFQTAYHVEVFRQGLGSYSASCFLTVEEIDAASLDLVKFAQQEAFTDVRGMLSDCDGFLTLLGRDQDWAVFRMVVVS